MNKNINISVVIPTLNGENHLKDFLIKNLEIIKTTLELENDFNKIEMIVINDNSNDKTINYLKKCKSKYNFLIFDTNPKQGAGSARNFGVSLNNILINNEDINYLLFIDNDVLLEKDFFINSVKYLDCIFQKEI